MSEPARLIVEVVAGLIPGRPEDEFTKRWAITSTEWQEALKADRVAQEGDESGWRLLNERAALADEYARTLRNPNRLNWVRVDWVWL